MTQSAPTFDLEPLCFDAPFAFARKESRTEAVVVVPARNEALTIPACLDALAAQTEEDGSPALARFEVLLLLNNCSDDSESVAQSWKASHPSLKLRVFVQDLPPEHANAGTARRLLMEAAAQRLEHTTTHQRAILSTDCDTVTHPQWVVRNLRALAAGADVVGGRLAVHASELDRLPECVRNAYTRDQQYRCLAAELEDRLDPRPGDRMPRHLDHFGASLACSCEAYARVGGLPRVPDLEDVAFVDAMRRVDAVVRHDPTVKVYTSPRLQGRAQRGFAPQLQLWCNMKDPEQEHRVFSAALLKRRFTALNHLRRFYAGEDRAAMTFADGGIENLFEARSRQRFEGEFLAQIDCDRLIEETFKGERECPIAQAISELETMCESYRRSKEHAVFAQP